MDIDYLLLLQNFRQATSDIFSPFLIWVSDFDISFWPVAMMCMIYWVFDRKAGRRIMAGFGLGDLMNGMLKLIFRVTRPWLRDARIVPYGDSITTATGYSFPSGHATMAASIFGGTGWWQRKRNRAFAAVLFVFVILVMFSRNYLGVHTPQDVFTGVAVTAVMMFAAYRIEDWTDKDIRRDLIVMAGGILVCAVLAFYYNSLNIQAVYDSTGALAVDPAKMKADSFEGIGFISAFVICRYFERRYFRFDTELKKKDRFIICTFALIPLYLWYNNIFAVCLPCGRAFAKFAENSGIVVYAMIIVPFIMSRIKLPAWMKEDDALKA